ncbi:MAG: type II toxin-antitoxin system YafQ family toxin [Rickettsiales bacterium]
MRDVVQTNAFLRDLKKAKKRNKPLHKLAVIVELLANGAPLAARHRPHPLKGIWVPNWECHIEPDWLLVYEVRADAVYLVRLGTHTDLFD